jgi:hypothetical protein
MALVVAAGPSVGRLRDDVQVADYFTAPSHFVKETRTVSSRVRTYVVHPLVDSDMFDPVAVEDAWRHDVTINGRGATDQQLRHDVRQIEVQRETTELVPDVSPGRDLNSGDGETGPTREIMDKEKRCEAAFGIAPGSVSVGACAFGRCKPPPAAAAAADVRLVQ